MPRTLVLCAVLSSGCLFSADYGGGQYTCTDNKCPSGLVCSNMRCIAPSQIDAPLGDVMIDTMIDARMAALTCVDPGVIAPAGGTEMGTTVGRTSTISAMCGGFVMNGNDAVYRVTAAAGDMYLVGITGVRAYVIAPCSAAPATPMCLGNAFAMQGNPISFTAAFAGQHFIVVDHENVATSGAYTLTVTKQ
jgi:hypothetical protein